MSRLRLPRRFRVAVAAAVWTVAGAGVASAQMGGSEPRAMTVIGGDAAGRRCVEGVIAGDSTDTILDVCNHALQYRRLSNEGRVQLLVNRGVIHLRRRESAAALSDFDAVLAIDRRHAEAQLNRGAALVQLGDYGGGVAAITEALGLGVREPHKAYFNRGAAREALGDLRGAYEDYSTALEIQPDWGPANEELARFARGRREHLAERLNEPTP